MSNARLILSADQAAITHESARARRRTSLPLRLFDRQMGPHGQRNACNRGRGNSQLMVRAIGSKNTFPDSIDCNIVPEGLSTRLPQLAVFDMDSTLIAIECIDELAKAAGVGEEVSAITAAAMRGELDFAESFKNVLPHSQGLPVSVVEELAANLPLMPGVEQAIADLHTWGCKIVIASGGFTHMANVLGKRLGAHHVVANELEIVDGKLTGKHVGNIVTGETKKDILIERASAWGIRWLSRTIAIGDGANDLR